MNSWKQFLLFTKEILKKTVWNHNCKPFLLCLKGKKPLIFQDIINYFKQLGPGAKTLLSEVGVIVKLVMILPATTASPERSFSKMKLSTKTYLRSTMTQPRLNHFMILGIYPEKVDQLDSKSILEEFIRCKGREKLFGKNESSGPLKTPMPKLQLSLNRIMSLNWIILCSKLKNGLCKIVLKSQVVTKSRLHCMYSKFLIFWVHSRDSSISTNLICVPKRKAIIYCFVLIFEIIYYI